MRFCLTIAIALTLFAGSPTSLLWAENPVGEHEKKHDEPAKGPEMEKGHSSNAGHPTHVEVPNPFEGTLDLTIWTMVVFLLLLGILYKFAWQPIREGLDKREHDIAHDKEEALKAREEAARTRSQLESESARAQDQIRAMLDKARGDAETLAAQREAQSKANIQAERDRLTRDLAAEREAGLQEIWTRTATLSTLVAGKVLQRQLNGDDHRRLIDEALADLRSAAEAEKRDILSVRA
jgi:F-type H+-transporting ATPase subunit b